MIASLFSILATIAVGVLYQIPPKSILPIGFLGLIAHLLYIGALDHGLNIVVAAFLASVCVSLISEGFARQFRMPVTVFAVPGVVSLVPGSSAYMAMRDFVIHENVTGISMLLEAAFIAGAIASGLVMAGVVARAAWGWRIGSRH
ncbi:threonine/serine exporter family protein [Ferroacidibacillus organovorans]|uniref:Threonine/Serine exporter ThrE domain-containing protein n=1 Tax=Ferroacidibacillus organovorans TaxID=1765683 RepID=A0A853KF31_9BACL|nr:threonine/serine exporter family protein [Ferroacidibacillus organovorans]KYP81953.1 hypothetical protein AYJ22_05385 [Ferroacidibacillus organovorans]OAG94928.1 hypothetical protein AYW79_02740 [Ferroacidibacillus organovorans]